MSRKIVMGILFFVMCCLVVLFIPPYIDSYSSVFSDDFEDLTLNEWSMYSGIWSIVEHNSSHWLHTNPSPPSYSEIQAGADTWSNYELSFDIFPVSGTDRNVFFRIQNDRSIAISNLDLPVGYMLHLKTDRIVLKKWTITTGEPLEIRSDLSIPNNTETHIKIALEDNTIRVYLNNSIQPSIEYIDQSEPFLQGKFALGSFPGNISTEVLFDNVAVLQDISTPTPTRSPKPTLSPSPSFSPSPTSTPVLMNVPNLKQYEGGWENDSYDHTAKTIEEYGCALTSAAMLLSYHGHEILPDTLNDWLKSQPDGYVRNGMVNWIAIARYSENPKLEFRRLQATMENILTEITNMRPSILGVSGHFVVAKGLLYPNVYINDPGYPNIDTLDFYPDLISLNTFRPSNTDLSYVFIVTNEDIELKLLDPTFNELETINYIENPISSIHNDNVLSNEALSILSYAKPTNQNLFLKTYSEKGGEYLLDIYLYDTTGNVSVTNLKGISFKEVDNIYTLDLNANTKVYTDFEQILKLTKEGYKNDKIRYRFIYRFIINTLKFSEKIYNRGLSKLSVKVLKRCHRLIKLQHLRTIDQYFSNVLCDSIDSLIEHIKLNKPI